MVYAAFVFWYHLLLYTQKPTQVPSAPQTIGIFQYSRLYACPQPGSTAERNVAFLGSCLMRMTVSFVTAVSLALIVAVSCPNEYKLPEQQSNNIRKNFAF